MGQSSSTQRRQEQPQDSEEDQHQQRRNIFANLSDRLRRTREDDGESNSGFSSEQQQHVQEQDEQEWVMPTTRRRRRTSSSDETQEQERKRRQRSSTLRRLARFGSNLSPFSNNDNDGNGEGNGNGNEAGDQAESSQQAAERERENNSNNRRRRQRLGRTSSSGSGATTETQTAMLSRLLAIASTVTANTLVGSRSSRGAAVNSEDGTFDGFLNGLRNGLLHSELNSDSTDGSQPRNFFRMFRFPPSETSTDDPPLIPIMIVGIRSVDNTDRPPTHHDLFDPTQFASTSTQPSHPEPASSSQSLSWESMESMNDDDDDDDDDDEEPIYSASARSRRDSSAASTTLEEDPVNDEWMEGLFSNIHSSPPPPPRHPPTPSELRNNTTGTTGSNAATPAWIVYVVSGAYPEDHPVLLAPSLFTDNPRYEDLMTLQAFLGQAKPPTATREEVDSSGGVYTVTELDPKLEERCLVCLSQYEQGEQIRELKLCNHSFHSECIDQWLTTGRNSCPLCRGEGVQKTETNEEPQASSSI